MPALLKSRIFYALVALTALAIYLFGFRWTPENQVRIKQKQLFSAIESNDSDKLEKLIAGKGKKLSNEKFVANAPAEVVEKERASLANMKTQLSGYRTALRDLDEM